MSSSTHRRLENYDLAVQLAACDAVTDGTTESGITTGGIGKPTSKPSNLMMIPTLAPLPEVSKTESLQDLVPPP
jgi:hypothetical protein